MTRRGRYTTDALISSADLPFTKGAIVTLPARCADPIVQAEWLRHLADPAVPKLLDLFCGAGGMSAGFVSAGFTVAAACDHDGQACKTFAANIPARVLATDIAEIPDPARMLDDLPVSQIDVIIGGPPCQGFSQVGRGRIRSLADSDQIPLLARNELYQQFFRFIETFQPAFFVMENVPALKTFASGAYMDAITRESARLGYDLESAILDAADYGVPQIRRRLFIVGSRVGGLFHWPRVGHDRDRVPLAAAIGDLPSALPPQLEECLPYDLEQPLSPYQHLMRSFVPVADRAVIYDHVIRPVREDDREIFTRMQPGDRYIDIDERYRRYNAASFQDKYYMLRPDAPGVTITAHLYKDGYRYIHWDTAQHRTISVREAARIQSFRDDFRFTGSRSSRFRQIGNAVPPLLAEHMAAQIRRALRRTSGALPGDILQPPLPGMDIRAQLINSHP
ncbi:MAG: DNA cytosine methyltransferase [Chloroflexota bacterium]|nr:DNA cytosine methyltransferase [Chloroflexota bacterium]